MLTFPSACLTFSAFALSTLALGVHQEHFNVTFSDSPQKFSLRLDPSFVGDLKDRVSKTKYIADDLSVPAYVEGPTRANASAVGKYWAETYDWSAVEAGINQQYVYAPCLVASLNLILEKVSAIHDQHSSREHHLHRFSATPFCSSSVSKSRCRAIAVSAWMARIVPFHRPLDQPIDTPIRLRHASLSRRHPVDPRVWPVSCANRNGIWCI